MTNNTYRWIVADDTDSHIQYSGRWVLNDGKNFDHLGNFGPTYLGTVHSASSPASFSYSFTGTHARIYGTSIIKKVNGVTNPTWQCFVDGTSVETGSLFESPQNNWGLCVWANLTAGPHVITVNVTSEGFPFYLDYINYKPIADIDTDSNKLGSVQLQHKDSAIQYGPGWSRLGTLGNMTSIAGSYLTVPFVGTSVSWYGVAPAELPRGATTGSFSVDKQPPVTFSIPGISTSTLPTQFRQLYFKTPRLEYGSHELKVTYEGNSAVAPLVLDSLVIHRDSTSDPSGAKVPIAAILGSVLGSVFFIGIMLLAFSFWRRRKRSLDIHLQPYVAITPVDPDNSSNLYPHSQQSPRWRKGLNNSPARLHAVPQGRTDGKHAHLSNQQQSSHPGPPSMDSSSIPESSILRHQDSGIRLPNADVPLVEIPPEYTPG
ncbi:hypothetical protein B0H34DRAFT_399046 [Crassisporium funariophilum]|nr:hypothetical protein B0H34DRAFT_399046 [Crassisporium funariophilum]